MNDLFYQYYFEYCPLHAGIFIYDISEEGFRNSDYKASNPRR
jgi:hypothetical protein